MVFSIFILLVFLNDLRTSVAIEECWCSHSMLRGVVWGQNWMNALICTGLAEEACLRVLWTPNNDRKQSLGVMQLCGVQPRKLPLDRVEFLSCLISTYITCVFGGLCWRNIHWLWAFLWFASMPVMMPLGHKTSCRISIMSEN